MWHFGTWFSRHAVVLRMVVLDDLRGLFQSMILWKAAKLIQKSLSDIKHRLHFINLFNIHLIDKEN